jgi:hypothetical protein
MIDSDFTCFARRSVANVPRSLEMEVFTILILTCLLGLIPAFIAHQKGRSFVLWWQYGAMLFIVALPHALVISALPRIVRNDPSKGSQAQRISVADEIEKLALLRSKGVLNEDEFQTQKTSLLANSIDPPPRLVASPFIGIAAVGLGLASILTPYFAAVFFVPVTFICGIIAIRQGHKGYGGVSIALASVGLIGLIDLSQEVTNARQTLETLQNALKLLNQNR